MVGCLKASKVDALRVRRRALYPNECEWYRVGGLDRKAGGQRTEDRRRRTEDRGQRTEDRGRKTEDGRLKAEG